ncbi:MAG: sulfatase-like hydrolase/transferase, partial [Pirellulaceae bacterium]
NPFEPTPDSESRASQDKQRNFEDMVAYMDKMIGRVVKKTEELGVAENTLIMFCGDNGTNTKITSTLNGKTIVGGKGMTTDAGTRVPLVASWPGVVPADRTCDDLVDFSDFLPTCLGAAGKELPAGLDGQSFLPQLRGETGQPRDWIYCYYCPRPEKTPPRRFARDQRWKLYGDGGFFDVENDVFEKRNLASSDLNADAAAARSKLQGALDAMPNTGQNLLEFVPPK